MASPKPTPTPKITPAPTPQNKPTTQPSGYMQQALDKLRAYARGLVPEETAPSQAGRKGADLDEIQKKADKMAYGE